MCCDYMTITIASMVRASAGASRGARRRGAAVREAGRGGGFTGWRPLTW